MVAMVILPSRHGCMCVPLNAQCARCNRELHHSYFIYYGHDTLQNCVIHTNPHTNIYKWHMAWLTVKYSCLKKQVSRRWITDGEERELELPPRGCLPSPTSQAASMSVQTNICHEDFKGVYFFSQNGGYHNILTCV